MKFDEFLKFVGEFGAYQRRLYVLLSMTAAQNAMVTILTVVFLFAVPDHRCAIPGFPNDTYHVQDEHHQQLINLTIPLESGNHGDLKYSQCELYQNITQSHQVNSTEKCRSWVYDKDVFHSTISSTLNLVCDQKGHRTHAKVLTMVGHLIGVLISGPLSDMFGRRSVLLVSMILAVTMSICLTWVNSWYLLVPFLVIISASFNTQFLSSFIYSMEIVGPSKRMITGVAMNLFWSAGNMMIALYAYLLRDWQTRQLIVSVPGILFIYLFFIPESPRWQISKGKRRQALKTLSKIAKYNKVTVQPETLKQVTGGETREPFWKLLGSTTMLRRCLILCYNWFAVGMGFYGLSMNVTNLSGNIYLNFFLFASVEACAYIICIVLLGRIGRKKMLSGALLFAGLACSLSFVPILVSDKRHSAVQWAVNVLACLGNTSVSAAFAAVYVFSAELLPTTSRNFGMSLCSVTCRVGSLLSPYINDLTLHITGKYSQILPMLIFGGVTALAGLLALLLPETFGKRLPESIAEAEKLGTKAYEEIGDEKEDCLLKSSESEAKCVTATLTT